MSETKNESTPGNISEDLIFIAQENLRLRVDTISDRFKGDRHILIRSQVIQLEDPRVAVRYSYEVCTEHGWISLLQDPRALKPEQVTMAEAGQWRFDLEWTGARRRGKSYGNESALTDHWVISTWTVGEDDRGPDITESELKDTTLELRFANAFEFRLPADFPDAVRSVHIHRDAVRCM